MTATSARKDFPVFDCDSHVVEPPAIWDEHVPAKSRAWVKSQFCFHTDSDLLFINGRVVPAARERYPRPFTIIASTEGPGQIALVLSVPEAEQDGEHNAEPSASPV